MIRKLLFGLASLTAVTLNSADAQTTISATGGNFENWTAVSPIFGYGTGSNPNDWISSNNVVAQGGTASVVQSSDKHGGNSAAEITTVKSGISLSGIPDTAGLLMVGKISMASLPPKLLAGYSFNNSPASLKFYYKYTPSGFDSAFATVILTKWNGSKRDTVGGGILGIGGTTTTYQQGTVAIVYAPLASDPDTAIVVFSSSRRKGAQIGSKFLVDDVTFEGGNVGIPKVPYLAVGVSAYPNPAVESFTISTENRDAYQVSIYDITGKLVSTRVMEAKKAVFSTLNLTNGVYFYRIQDRNNQTLATNKFDVIH